MTVYGSVAHEFAYQGIPVLLAGDNPCASYKFCYVAKSIKDYKYYLKNITEIQNKIVLNKSSIEEFFYMHYLHNHMGRISGNNDLFKVRSRDYSIENKNIFQNLVSDAENGLFDRVSDSLKITLQQLDQD